LISEDWQKAFDALFSEHLSSPEDVLEDKKQFAREVATRGLLCTDLLRKYWLLYVASSADVFLPLCLGARKIQLLDPCFKDVDKVVVLDKRIQKVFGVVPEVDFRGNLKFPFDFGEGSEEVTVQTIYGVFPEAETDEEILAKLHDDQIARLEQNKLFNKFDQKYMGPEWCPTEPLAMLLGFSALMLRLESQPKAMDLVVRGGCIFNTTRFEGLRCLTTAEDHKWDDWDEYSDEMPDCYKTEGTYEFIPLQHNCFRYTFLRRL
jgi:hypothetical protein